MLKMEMVTILRVSQNGVNIFTNFTTLSFSIPRSGTLNLEFLWLCLFLRVNPS